MHGVAGTLYTDLGSRTNFDYFSSSTTYSIEFYKPRYASHVFESQALMIICDYQFAASQPAREVLEDAPQLQEFGGCLLV